MTFAFATLVSAYAATALGLGGPPPINGPTPGGIPALAEGIEISDRRGAQIPLDLAMTDQDGQPVMLSSYFDGKHPVVLVLAYYQCPMLCSVVLNGLVEGMKGMQIQPGKDYRVVVVSFDPRDDVAKAAAKRKTYLESLGKAPAPRGYDYLVGKPQDVARLARTVGFAYRWDEKQKQFAHAAGIFLLTPTGTLSNTMMGVEFKPRDLEFGLIEASGGKIGSTWKKVLLLCYHWDPNARGYVWGAFKLFQYWGAATLAGLVLLLSWGLRMERRRKRNLQATEPANVRT